MQLEAKQIINQIHADLLDEFYVVRHEKECCYRDCAG